VRVLCIDNEARIQEGMRLLLEGWGCSVTTAGGSEDLDAMAELAVPDVILADYHLDNENGLRLIRQLRRRFGADVPAVLVTADRSTEVREAAAAIDVPVINKPVKPANLRALLMRHRKALSAAE
jgi:CheY-like chemotaxis protein